VADEDEYCIRLFNTYIFLLLGNLTMRLLRIFLLKIIDHAHQREKRAGTVGLSEGVN